MNKKRIIALFLGVLMIFSVAACDCGGTSDSTGSYEYKKTSDELTFFETSDTEMNLFLNEFFKRHVGYVDENGTDYSVNTLKPGLSTTNMFYQEWMSTSLFWFNSFDGLETDRYTAQKNRVASIPVDEYGYVWCDDDAMRTDMGEEYDGYHRMGWPFPSSKNSGGYSHSWLFNGNDEPEWTTNFSSSLTARQGLLYGSFTGLDSIEFTSELMTGDTSLCTWFVPYLEIDLRMFVNNFEDIDDVYVWFTTSRNEDFSEDKCVSAKDIAAINYEFNADYQHLLYFPMYAHPEWNSASWNGTEGTNVYRIKIEIRAKEGCYLSGDCGLASVRSDYDTRHANNNGLLLAALKNDYAFTGDLEYLKQNITRARKAMNFYMQMYNKDRHLIYSSYMIGHNGDKRSTNVAIKGASALGNGYWDASYMPEYDFQTNYNFYKGLISMAYLEKIAEENNFGIDKSLATIKTADKSCVYGTATYNYDSNSLTKIAEEVLSALRESCNDSTKTGFWNSKTGRFVAGYDINTGDLYDFGYIAYNLEALYLGIPTETQKQSIMDWISGKRIVESDKTDDNGQGNGNVADTGIGGSTGSDIYYFSFAPRTNTVNQKSPSLFSGIVEADRGTSDVFGKSEVQFGGAMLWTSFYDIMSRLSTYGVDSAYSRLDEIKTWFNTIYNYHISAEHETFRGKNDPQYYSYFYYDYYYNNSNLLLQGGRYGNSSKGGNAQGIMGVDSEFVESFLVMSVVPYGFLGLSSGTGKTLNIAPSLPSKLTYWKVENLAFNKVKYDLTILKKAVRIDSVRGDASGLDVSITLDEPSKDEAVYVNGKKVSDYTTSNGKISLTVALKNTVVEVK